MSEFSGKTVLIVEDEQDLLYAYDRKLRAIGFDTGLARNFEEAAHRIRRTTYHIAWIDLQLNGGLEHQGHSIVRALRELNEGTQILVVTSHDQASDVKKSLIQSGAHNFISKSEMNPFDDALEDIVPELRNAIANCTVDDATDQDVAIKECFNQAAMNYNTGLIISKINQADAKRKMDAGMLNRCVNTIYQALKPIRRKKNTDAFVEWKERDKIFSGSVWSKRRGSAVMVKIGPHVADTASIITRDGIPQFSVVAVENDRDDYED